jgi:hypothetical protein
MVLGPEKSLGLKLSNGRVSVFRCRLISVIHNGMKQIRTDIFALDSHFIPIKLIN